MNNPRRVSSVAWFLAALLFCLCHSSVARADSVQDAQASIQKLKDSISEREGTVNLAAAKDAFRGFMQVLKDDGESSAPLILGSTWRKLGARAFSELRSINDEAQRREVLVEGLSVKPRLTKEMWGNMRGFVFGSSLDEEILAYDGPITGYESQNLYASTLLQLNQWQESPYPKVTARVEALMAGYDYLPAKTNGLSPDELYALGILTALGHVQKDVAIERIESGAKGSSDPIVLGSAMAGLYLIGPEARDQCDAMELRVRAAMRATPTPEP